MKKLFGKTLAMAVMMSMFAGQVFAAGANAVEVGSNNPDTGYKSPAANGTGSVVIGNAARDTSSDGLIAENAVVIGNNSLATETGNIAIGHGSRAWATNGVAIGDGAIVNWVSSYGPNEGWNVAVGKSSMAYVHSTALGGGAHAGIDSIAIGYKAEAGWVGSYSSNKNSIAIGNEAEANFANSLALGNGAEASVADAIAIGNNSKATEADTISVGNDTLKRRIVNVAAGENDTDAVNFSQIKAVDGNYVKEANTVAENFTALDDQVKTNADDIATLKTDKADKSYVDTELAKKANAADVYTKSDVDTKLDAKANAADVYSKSETDAAIAASAYDDTAIKADIAKKADQTDLDTEASTRENADIDLQNQIDALSSGASTGMSELTKKINATDARVDRVGATAAALAAINYQPMAKGQSQVAIGMGGYNGKKATAIGLAYQFDNRISGSVAGAANGSEHMFNVGFNYLFGQHTAKDIAPMAASNSVSLKEAELQAQVDSLNDKVARLEAMVKALAAK